MPFLDMLCETHYLRILRFNCKRQNKRNYKNWFFRKSYILLTFICLYLSIQKLKSIKNNCNIKIHYQYLVGPPRALITALQ